ncbi:hypothetical protein JHK85_000999 [Glycine max]|nr:hypothetical protein JHK85_000999 [Glycine max]KAG5088352.1 hypothetical protein JHK86_000964 [Glycine max]
MAVGMGTNLPSLLYWNILDPSGTYSGGSRMLGSTAFPCLTSGPSSLRTEECLVVAYIILALLLGIVAYDYQVQLLSREVMCFVDFTADETSDLCTAQKVGEQLESYHKASSLTPAIQVTACLIFCNCSEFNNLHYATPLNIFLFISSWLAVSSALVMLSFLFKQLLACHI